MANTERRKHKRVKGDIAIAINDTEANIITEAKDISVSGVCCRHKKGKLSRRRSLKWQRQFKAAYFLSLCTILNVRRLNIKTEGAIAQLGERLNGIQEVGGSIPPGSTKIPGQISGPEPLSARFCLFRVPIRGIGGQKSAILK